MVGIEPNDAANRKEMMTHKKHVPRPALINYRCVRDSVGGMEHLMEGTPHLVLPYMCLKDASEMRLVSWSFHRAATEYAWDDRTTRVQGSLTRWRACFPRAVSVCALSNYTIQLADLRCLRGVERFVDLSGCPCLSNDTLSDSALAMVRARTALLPGLSSPHLTDAAFASWAGVVREVDLSGCQCVQFTDAVFVPLRGVTHLDLSDAVFPLVTANALRPLAGGHLHTVSLSRCTWLVDASMKWLQGVHTLDISHTPGLTDVGLAHVAGVIHLDMTGNTQFTDVGLAHLSGVKKLLMNGCHQIQITDVGLASLAGIQELHMVGCHQPSITSALWPHLVRIYLESVPLWR
jgi:hypothetical protein